MHRTDKYSQHSSIIRPVWLNDSVFVYELSGCGFESSCSHLMSLIVKYQISGTMFSFVSWWRVKFNSKSSFEISMLNTLYNADLNRKQKLTPSQILKKL